MEEKTINERLKNVYHQYLNHLYGQQWDEQVSSPLLMHTFDDYHKMTTKVMIVGQETHSWCGSITAKPSMEVLLETYKKFKLGKSADYNNGKPPRYLRSSFWNFSRSIFHSLNCIDSTVTRQTNGFLWTNISKFDHNSTTPPEELQDRNLAGFQLLKDEIYIVNPDVIVFLTGDKYDLRIKSIFNVDVPLLSDDLPLVRLNFTNGFAPKFVFKTEHPRTLCQHKKYRGKGMYQKVLDKIIETVR